MTKSFDAPIKKTGNKITWEAHDWGVSIYVNGKTWGTMTYLGDENNHQGLAIDSWRDGLGDIYVHHSTPENKYDIYENDHTCIDVVFKENPRMKEAVDNEGL